MVKGEKYSKVRNFFKVMGCPKPDSVEEARPGRSVIAKRNTLLFDDVHVILRNNKLIQTDFTLHENSSVQTDDLTPIIKKQAYVVEDFRRIIDTNFRIYEGNLLFESKRFYLSRVNSILSLRLNSVFHIAFGRLKLNAKGLYYNFIRVFVKIVNCKIESNLRCCLCVFYKRVESDEIIGKLNSKYSAIFLEKAICRIIKFRKLYMFLKIVLNRPRVRFDASITDKEKTANRITNGVLRNIKVDSTKKNEFDIVSQLDFFTKEPYLTHFTSSSTACLVNVTRNAINQLELLYNKHGSLKTLYINVSGGGCSGFQYNFTLVNTDDAGISSGNNFKIVYNNDKIKILSNIESIPIIMGCTLDYQQELIGSKFVLENIKNTSKRCSCGNSFDLKE